MFTVQRSLTISKRFQAKFRFAVKPLSFLPRITTVTATLSLTLGYPYRCTYETDAQADKAKNALDKTRPFGGSMPLECERARGNKRSILFVPLISLALRSSPKFEMQNSVGPTQKQNNRPQFSEFRNLLNRNPRIKSVPILYTVSMITCLCVAPLCSAIGDDRPESST